MEHVTQIKQFMESNLAGQDLQSVMSASESKSCHLTWLVVFPCGNGGGRVKPVWMEARQEENKTKCFVYRSLLREIKPLPIPQLEHVYS